MVSKVFLQTRHWLYISAGFQGRKIGFFVVISSYSILWLNLGSYFGTTCRNVRPSSFAIMYFLIFSVFTIYHGTLFQLHLRLRPFFHYYFNSIFIVLLCTSALLFSYTRAKWFLILLFLNSNLIIISWYIHLTASLCHMFPNIYILK